MINTPDMPEMPEEFRKMGDDLAFRIQLDKLSQVYYPARMPDGLPDPLLDEFLFMTLNPGYYGPEKLKDVINYFNSEVFVDAPEYFRTRIIDYKSIPGQETPRQPAIIQQLFLGKNFARDGHYDWFQLFVAHAPECSEHIARADIKYCGLWLRKSSSLNYNDVQRIKEKFWQFNNLEGKVLRIMMPENTSLTLADEVFDKYYARFEWLDNNRENCACTAVGNKVYAGAEQKIAGLIRTGHSDAELEAGSRLIVMASPLYETMHDSYSCFIHHKPKKLFTRAATKFENNGSRFALQLVSRDVLTPRKAGNY